AALDIAVFGAALDAGAGAAQTIARAASALASYPLARRALYLSGEPHGSTLTRHLGLAIASGAISFLLLKSIEARFHAGALEAKIAAEAVLLLVNFLAQRDWVFSLPRRAAEFDTAAALRRDP
ncbi:MAG: GtrA family protein, partial [Bryobacteraceae bacterium]